MSFGLETVNRLEADFVKSQVPVEVTASYILVAYLISEGYDSLAIAVCGSFAELHGPEDDFLVEGETSFLQLYFEALRRTVFNENHEVWQNIAKETRRQAMVDIASALSFSRARLAVD